MTIAALLPRHLQMFLLTVIVRQLLYQTTVMLMQLQQVKTGLILPSVCTLACSTYLSNQLGSWERISLSNLKCSSRPCWSSDHDSGKSRRLESKDQDWLDAPYEQNWLQLISMARYALCLVTSCCSRQTACCWLRWWGPWALLIPVKAIRVGVRFYKKDWGAAIAQWINLRLPSCRPGFKPQAHHLRLKSICAIFVMWK